ncbi:hypothetical protein [Alienimonas californiensis]|uniref:Uncharacterized protein n=1 Tax=Alienimonas californiensis TaxID=2527989 RepID=A0A517PB73_9PLAN|nr:hypothetical protein [Alienimonas californiensis]QDT16643.1 hypothetical protein CA12_27490 [Alienimonas californiensis]
MRRPAAPASPPANFVNRLEELVAAAYPGVLAVSPEPREVLRDLAGLCRRRGWALAA